MASVTIKREHTDEVYFIDSVQHPVHLSSQVPAVEVYPINVVQGDSILVKLKYKEGMFIPKSDGAIADDNQHAHIHWSKISLRRCRLCVYPLLVPGAYEPPMVLLAMDTR